MKLLTDNKLRDATVSSSGASANYPARNLIDDFLRLRYQSNATSDSVTFAFDSAVDIDSFFVGYVGNVTSLTVVFYSDGEIQDVARTYKAATGDGDIRAFETGATKYWGSGPTDHWDDYGGRQFASRHFSTVTSVDEIVIEIEGTSPIYIGGCGGGIAIDMPPATAAWSDEYQDNSSLTRSPHGQVQQNYVEPYNKYNFSFDGVDMQTFNEIKRALRDLGSGGGAWVTFFEQSEAEFPPGYYTAELKSPQRERHTYSFEIGFTEAR